MTYRPALEVDRPALTALLTETNLIATDLPTALGESTQSTFLLAFSDDGALVGVAGLEPLGTLGLLRSVAVAPSHRGQYIGQTLVDGLLHAARHNGLTHLCLLTTTADTYFERLGFERVDRADVPEPVQQTPQFSSLCPTSAVVMLLAL
jgi:amino-acid N-acetyltransferase